MKIKALFVATLLVSTSALAALTPAQRDALKADVQADPLLGQLAPGPDNAYAIAAAYAQAPAAACVVWRTSVSPAEYKEAITWTAVDALTAGKARIWEWITASMTLPLDASKSNVRQGVSDAWGAGSATGLALTALSKRNANRLEKLFATGACTTASPSTMAVEGTITYQEVMSAMGW